MPKIKGVQKKSGIWNRRKHCNSLKLTRIKMFLLMRSYYFSILMGPCFIKLFHPSKFERVTAFPPISNPNFFCTPFILDAPYKWWNKSYVADIPFYPKMNVHAQYFMCVVYTEWFIHIIKIPVWESLVLKAIHRWQHKSIYFTAFFSKLKVFGQHTFHIAAFFWVYFWYIC